MLRFRHFVIVFVLWAISTVFTQIYVQTALDLPGKIPSQLEDSIGQHNLSLIWLVAALVSFLGGPALMLLMIYWVVAEYFHKKKKPVRTSTKINSKTSDPRQ